MILWIAWWGFYSKTEFLRIHIPLLSFQKWLSFEQKSLMKFSRGKWQKTCSFSWQLSDFSITSTVSIMCRPRNDFRGNWICYRSMLPIPYYTCVFFFFHSSFFFIKLYFLFNKRKFKKGLKLIAIGDSTYHCYVRKIINLVSRSLLHWRSLCNGFLRKWHTLRRRKAPWSKFPFPFTILLKHWKLLHFDCHLYPFPMSSWSFLSLRKDDAFILIFINFDNAFLESLTAFFYQTHFWSDTTVVLSLVVHKK